MTEVFINYRTGDGEKTAVVLETALSSRFGDAVAFRAAKSIPPGESFADALLRAVRRCSVLLAVIGPAWVSDARLRSKNDWVRREILEAFDSGARVIPILEGRQTKRLTTEDLPSRLARLARVQSLRLDLRDNGADLKRIGDELVALIPALKEAEKELDQGAVGGTRNSADGTGSTVQTRDISGQVGTIISGNQGQIHTGSGNLNTQNFSGDGALYVQGDNHDGVSHRFGGSRRSENDR
ncbi:hypothetical protein GCM10027589_12990 [Actinocorallia lasiicapitis]